MSKRKGSFHKGSICWALTNDDWSDLTVSEIAEVLGVAEDSVYGKIAYLRKRGIEIQYKKQKPRRKEEY